MRNAKLLSPYKLGRIELKNRIVMAPIRCPRAIGNIPNQLMVKYYEQRAIAGLIITEGISPSQNGLGFSNSPGIHNSSQVESWKKITDAVHSKDGKIFVQLMHSGSISHYSNFNKDALIIPPDVVTPTGQMWHDAHLPLDFPVLIQMVLEEIKQIQLEYISAATNAIKAGFDGIELPFSNGYLLEQFLSPVSNLRNDNYGGNIENRCRFLFEIIDGIIEMIGKDKVGVRLSPYAGANNMPHYQEFDNTYKYLIERLNSSGILYIHLVDHSSMNVEDVPLIIKKAIRKKFENTIIFSGGYIMESAQSELESGLANLIASSRLFINNPLIIEQFDNGWFLSKDIDMNTFYSPGEKGYTDYPIYTQLSPKQSNLNESRVVH
jgi:N-ethylmaleimide reductase